jgi:hypothetical protein
VTERDSEALLEEEGEAKLGELCAVAEAEKVACDGEPWEVVEAERETAPLLLALGQALGERDAAALAEGDKEATVAVPGTVAVTEAERSAEALALGLLDEESDGEWEELALPDWVPQAVSEGLPDAVGE